MQAFLTRLATTVSYSLIKKAFLESLGIEGVLSDIKGFIRIWMQKR